MDETTPAGFFGLSVNTTERRAFDAPEVDTERLLRSLGGRETLAKKIAATFVRDLEGQLELLFEAYRNGDGEHLALLAHRFKGNLSVLRADRAQAAAEDLEEAAREGEADGLDLRVDRLAAALRDVSVALSAWLDE